MCNSLSIANFLGFYLSLLQVKVFICLSDQQMSVDKTYTQLNNVSDFWKDSFIDNIANMDLMRKKRLSNQRTNVTLNIARPLKRVSEISGNVTIGGLMMVHEREDTLICGKIMPQGGIQALECMLYTIDWINNQTDFLPGFTLGAYILDDCDKDTYGLEQAVEFIKGSISNIDDSTYQCPDGSNPGIEQKVIAGVVGAASSVTSIQVANLLRLFKIPQVSYFSTSPELSNKQRFEYFLRTVPSDTNQAQAMVDIIKLLNWTYVSVIYEESNYGVKAFEVLEELLKKNGICLAVKERLTKDSGVAQQYSYDHIVDKLKSKSSAKGVIVFGSDQEVAEVMKAVKRNNATGSFYWIGSDGWSARSLVSDGNEQQVEGTISIQPKANPVKGFDDYFLSLTPQSNKRNPWFIEYWEHYFKCKWPKSQSTPYNQYRRECTGNEKMTYSNGYEAEKQLQFVSDAVLAFGYAFKKMHEDLCPNVKGLCHEMMPIDGTKLLKYLQKINFTGLSGDYFQFTKSGDGPVRYNLIHFKQTEANIFQWINVGTYEEDKLNLDLNKVQFRLNNPEAPMSVCSLPCSKGQAKKYIEGENCCWHCFDCLKYQILISETKCAECPDGYLPDEDKLNCIQIPEEYVRADTAMALVAIGFSSLGILCTFFVIFVFLKFIETPVVRASGRELSLLLLSGILMCFGITFVLLLKPSSVICGIQQTSIGVSFSIVFSAIMTKTNRISRIFEAGKKTTKRPSFISPKSQILICSGLVLIQLIITLLWFAFSPPKAINYFPNREDNQLVCAAYISPTYFIAFCYPIILIVICTVYAVLTRKIPEAFNESKYIGFTMYTTCVIWLAFVPIYFTTKTNISLNLMTMSIATNLSAFITLICLFTPKLYIILLHPEKNVRQSMMSHKQPMSRNNFSTIGTSSSKVDNDPQTNGKEKPRISVRFIGNEEKKSTSTQTSPTLDSMDIYECNKLVERSSNFRDIQL